MIAKALPALALDHDGFKESMAADNPYQALVAGFARALSEGGALRTDQLVPRKRPVLAPDARKVMIFAPHPDDEVIIGGLPLRMLRELNLNVINVSVTLGSRRDRRTERWQELKSCCDYIGFGLIATRDNGLESINPTTREQQPQQWAVAVELIVEILMTQRPAIIFVPHAEDWNKTHIGTHHLVLDALNRCPNFTSLLVETEFWGAMKAPNLMVESSATDVADLVAALSLHAGEVARNPYHLRLPAWMIDNVRRGAELIGGQGGPAPDFTFATLYRLHRWVTGGLHEVLDKGRFLSSKDKLTFLIAPGN